MWINLHNVYILVYAQVIGIKNKQNKKLIKNNINIFMFKVSTFITGL